MNREDIIVWPDESWCYRDELHEFTHMSDDYRVIPFGTSEWATFHGYYS